MTTYLGWWMPSQTVPEWKAMRHRRYYIKSLTTSGLPVPEHGGDLIVAATEENTDLDWELIYQSSTHCRLRQEPYDLEMEGPEGSFVGPAILVRSDGRSHVFRGVGTLDGFDPAAFDQPQ